MSPISAETETFTYNIAYLNRAPVAVTSNFPLPSIMEDIPENVNVGVQVGDVGTSIAADMDDMQLGIAITGADSTNGVWEYRQTVSTDWVPFPSSISPDSLLLLPYSFWIRFSPDEHFFGTAYFTALAWDMSANLTNSTLADTPTGPFSTAAVTVMISVTHLNDPPVVQLSQTEITYTETGAPVPIFGSSLNISDVDNVNLTSATVTLQCRECESRITSGSGALGMYSSGMALTPPSSSDRLLDRHVPPNFMFYQSMSDDTETEFVITPLPNGDGSVAAFERYLQSLYFESIAREPSSADRIVILSVNDGTNMSNSVNVTIQIALVNDEVPSVTLPNVSTIYTEGSGSVLILPLNPIITDLDDNSMFLLSGATVLLTGADLTYERLSVDCSDTNLICLYNSSNGILVISGNASVSAYEQILGSITYENSIEEPDGRPRLLAITVSDGLHESAVVQLTIETELINDLVPVVTPSQSVVIFTEVNQLPGSPPVLIAPTLSITDRDSYMFPLSSAGVELLDPQNTQEEGVHLRPQFPTPPMIVIDNSDPFRLSISSTTAEISPQTLEHILQNVEYFNTAVQPSGTNRTITITVYDNLYTGIAAALPVTVTVQFVFENDLPAVVLMTEVVMYSEGQELGQVTVAPNASVIDVDNSEISALLIELLANNSTISDSEEILRINLMGASVNRTNTSNFQVIELRGVALVDTYTLILRSLTYEHTVVFGNPVSGDRVVRVTPFDVNGTIGVFDEVMIAFEAVNNPPVLDLNGDSQPARDFATIFSEEGSAVYLTSRDFVLLDVDTPGLAFIEVTLSPVLDSSVEELGIDSSNVTSVSVQQQSLYSIRLQGQPFAPVSEFRNLLLSLTYFNGADEPTPTQRTVTIIASDGNNSTQASTFITIELLNDPPIVLLNDPESNFSAAYTEGGVPVSIAPNPIITDPDSQIASVEVRPTSEVQFSGDNISAPGLQYDASLQVYTATFVPTSTFEAQRLLAALTYQNNLLEPMDGDRVFCISVVDAGSLRSQEACIEVSLFFVNDNAPVFNQSSYSASIAENAAGMPVIRVAATDADSINSDAVLIYSIVSGDDCLAEPTSSGSGDDISTLLPVLPCRFAISNLTGEISTSDLPPDRELRDSYLLTVAVTDQRYITTVNVSITILDVNDVAPFFDPLFYNVTVPLGAQRDDTLAQLVVIDPDQGESVTILLDPPEGMGAFAVNSSTGRVYLTIPENELDPFTGQYTLMFTAFDSTFLFADTPATLMINVILNNEEPTFDQQLYPASVTETTTIGTLILTVHATDNDQGSHGEVEYSLDSTEVPFTINTTTGEITLTSSLDFETSELYIFNITASDRGRPIRSSFAQAVINVINENEHSPQFTQTVYTADVCESAPIGYEVLRVTALDADAGSFGEVTYSVSGAENCESCVTVDNLTGAVTVAQNLNFEESFMQFRLFVLAVDGSRDISFFDNADVTINVLNDNEYPPEFAFGASHTVTIPENYPTDSPLPGLQMFQPLATDMDACDVDQCNGVEIINNASCSGGSGLEYEITGGNEQGLFSINPTTGTITLTTSLDFEDAQQRVFSLSLYVTDGEFNSTADLRIVVTDFNDNLPVFDNTTYTIQIQESASVGSEVLQVHASDLDPTSQIMYSLSGENAQHFEINSTSGVITIAQALDFETIPAYQLLVTAADRPPMANTSLVVASLNIILTDVNDVVPHFDQPAYSFEVAENGSPGIIGMVLAEDEDSGLSSEIRYSILTVTPGDPSDFRIDTLSGVINVSTGFDREVIDRYSLTVEARDGGDPQLSNTTEVTVTILDENDNMPMFSTSVYNINVTESSSVGTVVLELDASDRDAGSNARLNFAILSGNDRGDFLINVTSGAITVAAQLDREIVETYSFTVSVSDSGVPSHTSTAMVEITISDEGDNPPRFTSTSFSTNVSENSPQGTTVLQVTAFDTDTGTNAEINYTFEPTLIDNPFTIDQFTGIISVANSTLLDRETVQVFSLIVTAFNPNYPLSENATTTATINILDQNDEAPVFTEATFTASIFEDFTPVLGTLSSSGSGMGSFLRYVTTVSATDRDDPTLPNSHIEFSLVGDSTLFSIDAQNGDIHAVGTLDREREDFYQLQVQARDLGNPPQSSFAEVHVSILDINDNRPVFSSNSYSDSTSEGLRIGGEVLRVSALDSDINENSQLRFLILQDSLPFEVNNISGEIRTTQILDREEIPSWNFEVVVTDMGFPPLNASATVDITILDENDNPPVLTPGFLNLTIPENTPPGTVIANFSVMDNDIGLNADFNISLSGQSSSFSIDGGGTLRISGPLDFETLPEFQFSVAARNLAPPHLTDIAPVFIQLMNLNDNPPVVNFDEPTLSYFEDEKRLPLRIGPFVTDMDGRNETVLIDGIIQIVNPDPREPSFPFTPTTEGRYVPYECPFEDSKNTKYEPCGIARPIVLTTPSDDLSIRNTPEVSESDSTIIFDASQQQYAVLTATTPDFQQTGLTIATWLWVSSSTSSEPLTILSKVSSTTQIYGLFCDPDLSLRFQYYSRGTVQSVTFVRVCSMLQGAWHHVAAVLDNTNSSQWQIHVYIDGELFGSQDIGVPSDERGRIYVGAAANSLSSPLQNYFNGRLHLLTLSNFVAERNNIACVIGCGVILISSLSSAQTPLTSYYNFTSRALIFEGRQPIDVYQTYLNSIVFVLPFSEPIVSEYLLSYTVQDDMFNCLPTFIRIVLEAVNDFQPQLSLNGATSTDFSTVFVEEGGPVHLVNQSSFSLTDMDLVEFPYTVMVQILDPSQPHAEEILAVQNIPSGMNSSYTNYILTLNGDLPLPAFEAVLRTITYDNQADEPQGTTRQVMFTVSDPPEPDVTALASITIEYVNDPPILNLNFSTAEYREGDGAVRILQGAQITDSDNTTLVSLSVSFSALDGPSEILSVDTTGTNIQASYDLATNTLSLQGFDSLQNYEMVLETLVYENQNSNNPTPNTRMFSFVLSDGVSQSVPTSAMLFFAAVNDAPVLDLNGIEAGFNFETTFVEDSTTVILALSPQATLMDVDNDTLEYINITLSPTPDGDLENLLISIPGEPQSSGVELVLTASSPSTARIEVFQSILRTLQYQNLAEEPTAGVRHVEFIASDSLATSMPVVSMIMVQAVNDPPILDLDTDNIRNGYRTTFIEGGPPVSITSQNVSIMDNDAGAEIQTVMIVIQNPLDGLNELIESTDQNVTLPSPNLVNNVSLSYMFSPVNRSPNYVANLLATLAYHNTRSEPTSGSRVISISVSDGIDPSNSGIVDLSLVSVNEFQPQFTQNSYSGSVFENLNPGAGIATVLATDQDGGVDGSVRYEIVSSVPPEGTSHFVVDQSGRVTTSVTLDREAVDNYILNVSAFDGGTPQLRAFAIVAVTVFDLNDNTPVFAPGTSFSLTVSESRQPGFIIETLRAIDQDLGTNSDIVFQGGNSLFTVQRDGRIEVAGALDADIENPVFMFPITVRDLAQNPRTSEANFAITVLDENDNAPEFMPTADYNASIAENEPTSTFILTVMATDRDSTTNADITFSFADPTVADNFIINATSGEISSRAMFDRESVDRFEFVVVATDAGSARQSSSATVRITITDQNDMSPMFNQTLYEGAVPENSPTNTPVLRVFAQDGDAGSNSEIRYSIVPNSEVLPPLVLDPLFSVNPITGEIYVNESTDYELQQVVNFVVRAQDLGTPTLTGDTTIRIQITDLNDNPPTFAQSVFRASVPENEVGYSVLSILADDMDSNENGQVSYSILNELDAFAIGSISGEITTRIGLDFESRCFYQVMVQAQDGGTPAMTGTAIVEVTVIPVSDIAPMFSQDSYMQSVSENLPAGTSVIQVSATDGDVTVCSDARLPQDGGQMFSGSGAMPVDGNLPIVSAPNDTIEFSLRNHNDVFEINNSSGLIRTLVMLDRESLAQYTLTVRATDSGGLFSEVAVTINVLDQNDNTPQFTQPMYSASTSENAPEGTPVLQVVATDLDLLDQGRLAYSLSGHPSFFAINNQTGVISVSGPIDFETASMTFTFDAVVQDIASNSDEAMVTVNITDTNDLPPRIETLPQTFTFMEGNFSLNPFPEIVITDPDSVQNLCSAEIMLSSPQRLNDVTATQCTCSSPTACMQGCVEFLQISPGVFSGTATQSNNGFSLTLVGNLSISTYVSAIEAVQYINVISNPQPQPRTVSLQVFDCQLSSNVLINTINIQPLNRFPPILDLNGVDLPDINFQTTFNERGSAVNIASQNVSITDNDTVGTVQELTVIDVWIVNPQDGNMESVYLPMGSVLPSGITLIPHTPYNISLSGTAPLSDYESALLMMRYIDTAAEPNPTPRIIRFIAREYHLSSETATTTVSFNTINDHAPIVITAPPLQNSMTTYSEGTSGVDIVASNAVIEDDDSTDDPVINLRVYVAGPATDDYLYLREGANVSDLVQFTRISDSFLDFNGTAPHSDYEIILRNLRYQYRGEEFESILPAKLIIFEIYDIEMSSFSAVQVFLDPVNDQMPVFTDRVYNAIVPENSSVGYSIVQVQATDSDRFSESVIQYNLSAGNMDNFFTISAENGTIYLDRTLDFETIPLHRLSVQATDLNYAGPSTTPDTVTVNIMIGDVNDHIPIFNQSNYNVSIGEGVPIGTYVLQVSASDRDSDVHSQLEFELFGTSDFVIDRALGIIRTNADIDREVTTSYDFTVTVRNPGNAPFNVAMVYITVLDLDDNPPILVLVPTTTTLQEPQTSVPLATQLEITDGDPNPSLDYALVQVLDRPNSTTPGVLLTSVNSAGVNISGNGTNKLEIRGESRSLEEYIQILRGVMYQDSSAEPDPMDRTIAYQVGTNPSPGPIELQYQPGDMVSNVSEFIVSVALINDNPPQLLLDTRDPATLNFTLPDCSTPGSFSTEFTEDGPPVTLSHGTLTITDADSGDRNIIQYAIVEITGPLDTGFESLSVEASGGITVRGGTSAERLVLEGPATLEVFAAVLRTVRYVYYVYTHCLGLW